MSENEIKEILVHKIAKELKVNTSDIPVEITFSDLGLDSISAMYLIEQMETQLKIVINPLHFWDYPTINKLSKKLYQENFNQ